MTRPTVPLDRNPDDPDSAPPELYEEPHWYAFRTRARSEKVARRALENLEVEAYLPLVRETREWSDRTKEVEVPLLGGFLFARLTLHETGRVLGAPRVVAPVRIHAYPEPIPGHEIVSLRRMVEGANETGRRPEPADYLVPGEEVRVAEGPFEGMEGVLLEERGDCRVAVKLDALRAARAVEIERGVLRPRAA